MSRVQALKTRAMDGLRVALGAICAASVVVSLLCFIANELMAKHQEDATERDA